MFKQCCDVSTFWLTNVNRLVKYSDNFLIKKGRQKYRVSDSVDSQIPQVAFYSYDDDEAVDFLLPLTILS